MDKSQLLQQPEGRQALLSEIAILRQLSHPNIQKLIEIYEDELSIFIVLEIFFGRNMRSRLAELSNLEEKSLSEIIQKLLSALNHMHQKNIVHRDIKLENIYFRTQNNIFDICIANFGFANIVTKDHPQPLRRAGTVGYLAPEIFNSDKVDCKVDIFSLGIVFYTLVYNKSPF